MKKLHLATAVFAAFGVASPAFALDQIVRPYQSVRTSGMGGVRLTTGLYDENFFGNPARATANPTWRVQLIDPMIETTTGTISNIGEMVGGDGENVLGNLASTSGSNNHVRVQTTFPSFYMPNLGGGSMSYAFGVLLSTQNDISLRKSFRVEPQSITDVGIAFTAARKFLVDGEEKFALGLTTHGAARVSSQSGYTFVSLIQGQSLSPLESGGEGAHIDFDLGGTFKLPFHPFEKCSMEAAFVVNNVLGGSYDMINVNLIKTGIKPPAQPRTFGFGVSGRLPELWKFTDAVLAFEVTDIGNNPNASYFRLFHLGGELRYGILVPRLGLNQGYWALGLGIDLKLLTIDVASYGEEMSLNVGGLEDRRVAARIALQI